MNIDVLFIGRLALIVLGIWVVVKFMNADMFSK